MSQTAPLFISGCLARSLAADAPSRPMVRYLGSKWRIAPWIISHFPPTHKIYVEPFAGGASVLLRKPRVAVEVYNDMDGNMVNLFRVARDHPDELQRRLELTPWSRDEHYQAFQSTDCPIEAARRMIVRGQMSFGSTGCASDSRRPTFRQTNVKRKKEGAIGWANWRRHMAAIFDRLSQVIIEQRPALNIIQTTDSPDTLFFVDPPYVRHVRHRGGKDGSRYYYEMDDGDHTDLLQRLKQVRGKVVICGYENQIYAEHLSGWRQATTKARANQNSPRTECIWMNY